MTEHATVKLHIKDTDGTTLRMDGVVSRALAVKLETELLAGVKQYIDHRKKETLDGGDGE